jgi:AcrR family transcriptional regulator
MPKEIFFNLPEEKRERITALAIEEFAENDYDLASISRIVSRATNQNNYSRPCCLANKYPSKLP